MEENGFNISFIYDEKNYTGRVNPSDSLDTFGKPASFHVILNNTSFGSLFFNDCNWTTDESRPAGIVKLVGKQIEKHYQL